MTLPRLQHDRIDPPLNAGFTLAEVLVASVMLSVVMASVYLSFSTAIRTWRSGEANYQTYENARFAMGLLTRELQAIPSGTMHLFVGTDDELEFYTLTPPMNVSTGEGPHMLWVRYRLKRGPKREGDVLMREEALVKSPLPALPPRGDTVNLTRIRLGRKHTFELATGVKKLSLQYHWQVFDYTFSGSVLPTNTMMVEGENPKGRGLPKGIEISLTLMDPGDLQGDGVSTFSSIVAYRIPTSPFPYELYQRMLRRL